MWTREQIQKLMLLTTGVVFCLLTGWLAIEFSKYIMLVNAPFLFVLWFLEHQTRRTLAQSREQTRQARRHMEELSIHLAEQKRIGSALEQTEDKFRHAFDYAAVGMALVAPSRRLLKVNRSLSASLGYDEAEFSATDFDTLLHADDRELFNLNLTRLRDRSQETAQLEIRCWHKSGHLIWLSCSASFVADYFGKSSHFIFQLQDVTERKRAEERRIYDAMHDALTGLPNRSLFNDRLKVAFKRANRHFDNRFAVLLLNFDRFKLINDSFGHAVGDDLLMVTTARLEQAARASDTIARLGGDEFAVLVEDVKNIAEAVEVAERLQNALTLPFNIDGRDIILTLSVGVVMWARDYDCPEFILRDADTAMHQAKQAGSARIEIFDAQMHERANKLLRLESDLRQAIKRGELLVHYQAIMNLQTNRLAGFEALMRWQHPENGLVSPADFIPVAEETNLILPMGAWILRESCRQLKIWQKEKNQKDLWVSVNVSTKQFAQPDFVAQVAAALAETDLSPACLKLEITESAMAENINLVVAVMQQLRDLGVKLSIDDFGTGYSSLSHLHRLPVHSLKIDRSFVKRMHESSENQEIVNTVVTLAHSLKLEIIAEGVENFDQISRLQKLRCQFGQGFYFSKPLDCAAIEMLFAAARRPLSPSPLDTQIPVQLCQVA